MKPILLITIIMALLFSCINKRSDTDYYIISEHEYKDPPPLPPPNQAWYSNLILIFDTTDLVYLYQTECNLLEKYIPFNYPVTAPPFIELTPDDLIRLNADYVKQFLLDNSEYFMLDTNDTESTRLVYLVSVADTIKNKAFYQINDMIRMNRRNYGAIFPIIRRTTEEERIVLSYKNLNKKYIAEDFPWSSNFMDGKTTPYTPRYDSLMKNWNFVIRAKQIFQPNMTLIPITE